MIAPTVVLFERIRFGSAIRIYHISRRTVRGRSIGSVRYWLEARGWVWGLVDTDSSDIGLLMIVGDFGSHIGIILRSTGWVLDERLVTVNTSKENNGNTV
jgi:hypothetical protein